MGKLLLRKQIRKNGKEKKKTRRSQAKKNIWKDMKIMMVNIRGLKSKENSLNEIIAESKPTVLLLMETLCEEIPVIEGYSVYTTKKRSDKWGGIMLAIRKELENQVQIRSEATDQAEIMFAQIICGKMNATIGLVYAPQENQTAVEELDKMYQYIQDEIQQAKTENQMIILCGDFNCKIGDAIKGNKKDVTKGGRRLLKLAKKSEMTIINTTSKCEGVWTRTQKEKSIWKKVS